MAAIPETNGFDFNADEYKKLKSKEEKRKKKSQERYSKNKDKVKESLKEWKEKNPDKYKESKKKSTEKRKIKISEKKEQIRTKIANGETITAEEYAIIHPVKSKKLKPQKKLELTKQNCSTEMNQEDDDDAEEFVEDEVMRNSDECQQLEESQE